MKQFGGELKQEVINALLIQFQKLANNAATPEEINKVQEMKRELDKLLIQNAQKEADQNIRKKELIQKLMGNYKINNRNINSTMKIKKLADIGFLIEEIKKQNKNNTTKKSKIDNLKSMINKYKDGIKTMTFEIGKTSVLLFFLGAKLLWEGMKIETT